MNDTNTVNAVSEEEKEHVNNLCLLATNEAFWAAVRWFAAKTDARMTAVQADLPIQTPDGLRDYFTARGRRIGLWDMITVAENEVAERRKKEAQSFTDLSKQ